MLNGGHFEIFVKNQYGRCPDNEISIYMHKRDIYVIFSSVLNDLGVLIPNLLESRC